MLEFRKQNLTTKVALPPPYIKSLFYFFATKCKNAKVQLAIARFTRAFRPTV